MSLQPTVLRKHGTRTHSQFFELSEDHHAFIPHKLLNHRFNLPKTINVGIRCNQDRDFSTINAIKR
jgi:hypothetical protein